MPPYEKDSAPLLIPFEKWLLAQIPYWRRKEPQGETSDAVYRGLFEYRSQKRAHIAAQYLKAIRAAVGRFNDLVMAAACTAGDEDVLWALHSYLARPKLAALWMTSHRALHSLLDCHPRDKKSFYDGFVGVGSMRRCMEGLAGLPTAQVAVPKDATEPASGVAGKSASFLKLVMRPGT